MIQPDLSEFIRTIPDFPQPGIQFKDITTLLKHGPSFRQAVQTFIDRYQELHLDAIVGIESRGFLFGAPLAYQLGVGMIPVRKPGKLPAETFRMEYQLEYGTNTIEIHRDALLPGARVLVIDDLLATGGTAAATCALIEQIGGQVVELAFLIELTFLQGRDKLRGHPIFALIQY
ncbi:MAG: adenine phosphoribosyltransferase [Chloroflexaceae bacterium]|nr:adenine phosphoribosyltransferase [Chloroflexaceae bacterium]